MQATGDKTVQFTCAMLEKDKRKNNRKIPALFNYKNTKGADSKCLRPSTSRLLDARSRSNNYSNGATCICAAACVWFLLCQEVGLIVVSKGLMPREIENGYSTLTERLKAN